MRCRSRGLVAARFPCGRMSWRRVARNARRLAGSRWLVQTVVRCSAMSDACIGPINPATNLPDETVGGSHQVAVLPASACVAFMSSCDRHLESLARWTGIRFGNCFAGGPIAKSARTMTEAAAQFGPITTPHGDEFGALLGVLSLRNGLVDPGDRGRVTRRAPQGSRRSQERGGDSYRHQCVRAAATAASTGCSRSTSTRTSSAPILRR